ncbi:KAP family P-loop NTPase fold protein [Rhizobium azibense]|uniref:KAP-like P-loop domain-containing protein n=1 Tax=Rhizobium azibense TaxID=1136135 RepID=A0A4R3RIB8_9HYPH|nr:P-loop NTPase fold protein [Rhizobium azibense]TCU35443.1 KAP-like P-loop domain-containing protein [Rhizobium azibense]
MSTTAKDIWKGDKLGRFEDADFLYQFLIGRLTERRKAEIRGSYVLNIDAEWGFGKTFFMERFARQLEADHPVVYIDAWKNDFSDDPYTCVISAVERHFKQYLDGNDPKAADFKKAYDAVRKQAGKIFWLGLKGGMKRGAKWVIGEGVEQIIEVVDKHVVETGEAGKGIAQEVENQIVEVTESVIDAFAEKRIKDFEEAKASLENFRDSLSALLTAFEAKDGKRLPLFVFIDELDRCRPPYAISMLERIKHLFDVDGVVFLISTDAKQLAHSIKGVYGASFDSQRYLQRFFSRTFMLPKASPKEIIDAIIEGSGTDEKKWRSIGLIDEGRRFLAEASTHLGMSLRETQQAMDILLSLTTMWNEKFPLQLALLYPLIYGHILGQNIDELGSDGWLESALKTDSDWKVEDVGHFGLRSPFRQINSGASYIRAIAIATLQPMRMYLDKNRIDQTSQVAPKYTKLWVNDILEREYAARFGNNVRENEYSIMREYGRMIRHAGNLRR